MSDYKDRILGTIFDLADTVTSKAKELAESDSVRSVYERSAGKAKSYARLAKLNLERSAANEELNKVYQEIGKLAYDQMKSSPQGFYAALFIQANEIETSIEAKQAEIDALRTELGAPESGEAVGAEAPAGDFEADLADFDTIVDSAEPTAASEPGLGE